MPTTTRSIKILFPLFMTIQTDRLLLEIAQNVHRPVVIVMVVMVPVVPSARSPFRITLFQSRDEVEEPPYEVGVDRAGDGGKDSASGLGPSTTVMRVAPSYSPGWRLAGPVTKSILFSNGFLQSGISVKRCVL